MSKKSIIITIIVAVVCLAIGGVSSYFITSKVLDNDKCETKEESKQVEDATTDVDIASEEDNESASNEDVSDIPNYDSLFLSLDVESSPEDLIKSSDGTYFAGDFIGAMYSENISLEYKAVYSLYQYLKAPYSSEYEDVYHYITENGEEFSISIDVLNKMISTFFADGKIEENFEMNSGYYNIMNIECKDNDCKVTVGGIGGMGCPPSYNSKVISNKNNVYTVASYYVKLGDDGLDIYTKKNGTLVKTITFDGNDEDEYNNITSKMYQYDSYASVLGSKLKKYKYTFNDSNQLVSVEEV